MINHKTPTPERILKDRETLRVTLSEVRTAIARTIIGQDQSIEETVIALLGGGHVLLVGVPGLGKTRLVHTLGRVFGLVHKRVQCTADLMPGDILGSEILDETPAGKRSFRFIKGPVFCQLLMADEINRASPRTQSAMLQAMQEKQVSVAGKTYDLPRPFYVLATQNPVEQEGTYPLPEAQLDRFMMQVRMGYPDSASEHRILTDTTGEHDYMEQARDDKIMDDKALLRACALITHVPVPDNVQDAILRLVRGGRPESSDNKDVRTHVQWGPGPRAGQSLMRAVRARAVLHGQQAASLEDLRLLAKPVLRHRMAVGFAARADGLSTDDIIDALCNHVL